MKILLDECVTNPPQNSYDVAGRLKPYLPGHEVLTVTEKRWNGLKNGQLLEKAVEDNFDLLLTIDKNIMYQQKIDNYNIIVVVIDSPSSKIEFIKEFIPRFNEMLVSFERGNIYEPNQKRLKLKINDSFLVQFQNNFC